LTYAALRSGGSAAIEDPGIPRFVDYEHVARMLAVDRATIRRWVAQGNFPRPLNIGGIQRWRLDHLLDELERLRDRDRRPP
jgi:predicted DNA-binding transcriptional regulator AlpA